MLIILSFQRFCVFSADASDVIFGSGKNLKGRMKRANEEVEQNVEDYDEREKEEETQ